MFFDLLKLESFRNINLVYSTRGRICSFSSKEYLDLLNFLSHKINSFSSNKKKLLIASLIENSFYWSIVELAVINNYCIHIPLLKEQSNKEIQDKLKSLKIDYIITDSKLTVKRLKLENNTIKVINLDEMIDSKPVYSTTYLNENKSQGIIALVYTSGSSGLPKAICVNDKNIYSCINEFMKLDFIAETKSYLSLLHHSFSGGRKVYYSFLFSGKRIYHKIKSKTIIENINTYKPDTIAVVPYMLEEIYAYIKEGGNLSIRFIICGGAKLPIYLEEEFGEYNIKIINVYGLTETCSLISYNTLKMNKKGSVGRLSPQIQHRFSSKGELLVKGSVISPGYFVDGTIQSITDNAGYFNTRDIVWIDDEGFLFISNRTDGLMKNKKGIYINEK